MQYYIKIYNRDTHSLVGYYRQSGVACISRLLNGIKYWNNLSDALSLATELSDGFLRDADGHYYNGFCVVYGDSTRAARQNSYKNQFEEGEEYSEYGIDAYLRQNSRKATKNPRGDY